MWRKEREEQRDKNREKEARVDEKIVQGLAHFFPYGLGKEGSSSVIGEVEEMMISVSTREKSSFLCVLISVMILASHSCSYHSPSSESSDGDSEEVLSMKQLRSNDLNQFIEIESAYVIEEAATQEDQRTEIVLGANDSSPSKSQGSFL